MLTEAERRLIGRVAAAGGLVEAELNWNILDSPAAALPDEHKNLWSIMNASLMSGLLRLAADGYEFVPASRIQERFGKTLRANYPEATPAFLRFATGYWTLKLWVGDHAQGDLESIPLGKLTLVAAEDSVESLFFPTPGPVRIDPNERERAQRKIFHDYRIPIDVDEFMAGNPILMRDRASERSGCLGSLVALAAAALTTTRL